MDVLSPAPSKFSIAAAKARVKSNEDSLTFKKGLFKIFEILPHSTFEKLSVNSAIGKESLLVEFF